jgi:hypothetical protein
MEEKTTSQPITGFFPRRLLWLGYLFQALLALASSNVVKASAMEFGAAVAVLSLPAMAAFWHRSMARRLLSIHQFEPGGVLHRWGSRRFLITVWQAVVAVALAGSVLLQSVFFGPLEWALIASMPVLFLLIGRALQRRAAPQFRSAVHGRSWIAGASGGLLVVLVWAVWTGFQLGPGNAAAVGLLERVHDLQSVSRGAHSGIVKWGLDAGAWGQASIESLHEHADRAVGCLLLAAIVAPLTVLSFMVVSVYGLALPLTELRRTLGSDLSDAQQPARVRASRAALWSAMAVLGAMVMFQTLAVLEQHL